MKKILIISLILCGCATPQSISEFQNRASWYHAAKYDIDSSGYTLFALLRSTFLKCYEEKLYDDEQSLKTYLYTGTENWRVKKDPELLEELTQEYKKTLFESVPSSKLKNICTDLSELAIERQSSIAYKAMFATATISTSSALAAISNLTSVAISENMPSELPVIPKSLEDIIAQ